MFNRASLVVWSLWRSSHMKKLSVAERAVMVAWLRGVAKTAESYADKMDPERTRGPRPALVAKLDAITRVANDAARYAEVG